MIPRTSTYLTSVCAIILLFGMPTSSADHHQEGSIDFYSEYLAKYYPKANAMCHRIFSSMTVAQVAMALHEIAEVLGNKSWFYFYDEPEGFKRSTYCTHIVDQFELIDTFLIRMRVNPDTQRIIELRDKEEGFSFSRPDAAIQRKMKPLRDVLKERHTAVIADFYAVYFDHVVTIFNEEILLQNRTGVDQKFGALERIVYVLRETGRENYYLEALVTCKELRDLLHQRVDANVWG